MGIKVDAQRALRSLFVCKESFICHLLILRIWTTIVGVGVDRDAASWEEDTCNFYIFGFHQLD